MTRDRTIATLALAVVAAVGAAAQADPAPLARHQRRCDAGDAPACLAAAEILDRTDGVADEQRLRYFTAACDGGASRGCFRAGALLAHQTPPSVDRVFAVFDRGCRGGDGASCGGAGSVLHNADFGPKDWARAEPYYRKACALGAAIACLEAGYDRAAAKEARAWRFRPYLWAGRAIPVCASMVMRPSAR